MKAEGFFFLFISVFMTISDIIYWYYSHDPTGTVCMALSAALGAICAFYLLFTGHRVGDQPGDLPDAEVSDAAGVVGHFSPHSPWPILIAFGIALGLLGLIFGLWLSAGGLILFFIGIPKLVMEYSSGPRDAHEQLLR